MRWRQKARRTQAIFEQKKMADFHWVFSQKSALKLTFGGVNRRRRRLCADRPTDSVGNLGHGSSVGFRGATLLGRRGRVADAQPAGCDARNMRCCFDCNCSVCRDFNGRFAVARNIEKAHS